MTSAPARRWTDADGIHVDVRGLPPPQPMTTIHRRALAAGRRA